MSVDLGDLKAISSTFQRRMLRWDVAGQLPFHLRENAGEIDLVVWDLMIERVGVQRVRGGGFVTNNPQTRQYARPGVLQGVISFGSDEHLRLWERALDAFVDVLDETGLATRTVVNATPWAVSDKDGNHTHHPEAGLEAAEFNDLIESYFSLIESRGIPIMRVPQGAAVADPGHKWGPAYFHYLEDTYRCQLELITELMTKDEHSGASPSRYSLPASASAAAPAHPDSARESEATGGSTAASSAPDERAVSSPTKRSILGRVGLKRRGR